jgi:hypothetical protein
LDDWPYLVADVQLPARPITALRRWGMSLFQRRKSGCLQDALRPAANRGGRIPSGSALD